jgi:hypothetical protein
MFHNSFEKKLLQATIALASVVPLTAGLSGIIKGAAFLGSGNSDIDSHLRYLSGLLLAIGLGFISVIPNIELQGTRVRLLTFIVVIGGLARLLGFLLAGLPGPSMQAALGMELLVTPLICAWQYRIAKRYQPAPNA